MAKGSGRGKNIGIMGRGGVSMEKTREDTQTRGVKGIQPGILRYMERLVNNTGEASSQKASGHQEGERSKHHTRVLDNLRRKDTSSPSRGNYPTVGGRKSSIKRGTGKALGTLDRWLFTCSLDPKEAGEDSS